MKKRFILVASALFMAAGLCCAAEKTLGEFKFSAKQKKNRYYNQFKRWAKQDIGRETGGNAVLFIGSSSMRMWKTIKKDLAPLKVIHRGFGGSTIQQVLLWENFFLRYKANTVVIYEGDNDLVSVKSSPEKFLNNCKKFCNALEKSNPKTKIYFLSIKPSISRMKSWSNMEKGNELLKKYAAENNHISYIDVAQPMMGKDGKPLSSLFLKDKLHMNKNGYAIWTKVVRAALIK